MGVQWIDASYSWIGKHPDVEIERSRRCQLGFTDDELIISNRGFVLGIPLRSTTGVHYVPHKSRSSLRFASSGGIDITLRETSGSGHLTDIAVLLIQACDLRSNLTARTRLSRFHKSSISPDMRPQKLVE